MIKRKRLTESERRPYYITLPKGAISPTDSIYKDFDIVMQTKALWSIYPNGKTVRYSEPFTIRVKVGKKIREIKSHKKD